MLTKYRNQLHTPSHNRIQITRAHMLFTRYSRIHSADGLLGPRKPPVAYGGLLKNVAKAGDNYRARGCYINYS